LFAGNPIFGDLRRPSGAATPAQLSSPLLSCRRIDRNPHDAPKVDEILATMLDPSSAEIARRHDQGIISDSTA